MATATARRRELRQLQREVAMLRATASTPALDRWRNDPAMLMADAGFVPDEWQRKTLRSNSSRLLLLCSRQAGKSLTAGALALREALLNPPALILMLSPTLRQSTELLREKFVKLYDALGRPVPAVEEAKTSVRLANGSRIISLPEAESNIRGFSDVALLVIDEASRVSDDLYRAVRPMLAVSGGKLVALSTPHGKLGWFFESWESDEPWERVKITAAECPRIAPAFLMEEWRALGEAYYRQEYECDFRDAVDQVFSFADVRAAMDDDVPPLFVDEVTDE
jgi:hypothetical protein